MRVGLNATCLNDRPSGARQRFLGIYRELVRRRPDVQFIVYEPADCRVASWFGGAPNVFARPTPLPSEGRARRFVEGLRYWRSTLAADELDIFEGFHLPLVKAPSGRTILTIHDVRGLREGVGPLHRAAFSGVLAASLRAADHVITVSEAMKSEILAFRSGVPISVVYNGLEDERLIPVSTSETSSVRTKLRLPDDFLLAVGHFEPRKNYLRLVDALARLRDEGHTCSLVIIGNDSGERAAVEARVAAAKLSDRVRILSGLTDLEVRCAYQLCRAFVFPSSYEGFGIPILEAMAAERPIVLSDLPVFREITQDKGTFVRHDDTAAMAAAIAGVLTSETERSRWVESGRERLSAFRYGSLAAEVESVYRSLT